VCVFDQCILEPSNGEVTIIYRCSMGRGGEGFVCACMRVCVTVFHFSSEKLTRLGYGCYREIF
jgi:hypothetical protein